MPRTSNPDPLSDLVKSFTLMSASGDANGWLSARAVWEPELRAIFGTHAPKKLRELESLLSRPIPPAFPAELPPIGVNLQQQLGQHRLARDAVAREVTATILAMLQEVQKAQSGNAGKRK